VGAGGVVRVEQAVVVVEGEYRLAGWELFVVPGPAPRPRRIPHPLRDVHPYRAVERAGARRERHFEGSTCHQPAAIRIPRLCARLIVAIRSRSDSTEPCT